MNTNKLFTLIALLTLMLAAQACGSGQSVADAPVPAASEAAAEVEPAAQPGQPNVESEFPMPDDAANIMDLGNSAYNFQTSMSQDEAVAFYRDAFKAQGLTEREITTTITEGVFSIVFDGHASGKAIAVQGVDLGDGVLNINIRFEDI
jgi:hypothetical protein